MVLGGGIVTLKLKDAEQDLTGFLRFVYNYVL